MKHVVTASEVFVDDLVEDSSGDLRRVTEVERIDDSIVIYAGDGDALICAPDQQVTIEAAWVVDG